MKDILVVGKLKEGAFEKFMGFMQSDAGMAERSKVANVSKTIGTVAPDKKTVMFKIFVTDKEALKAFINGASGSELFSKSKVAGRLDGVSRHFLRDYRRP